MKNSYRYLLRSNQDMVLTPPLREEARTECLGDEQDYDFFFPVPVPAGSEGPGLDGEGGAPTVVPVSEGDRRSRISSRTLICCSSYLNFSLGYLSNTSKYTRR